MVILLSGFQAVTGNHIALKTSVPESISQVNSEAGSQMVGEVATFRQSALGQLPNHDLEATEAQEEENELSSHLSFLAKSKFLQTLVCAFFFLFLFTRLKKGIPFYSRSTFTAHYRWYKLFQVFRI